MPRAPLSPRASAARRLRRSAGTLSTSAVAGMDEQLPWFRELSAEDRSWVGLIVQAGVQGFVEWYAAGADAASASGGSEGGTELAASVFGAAPRALTGVITLQQTVDLVRLTIDVVEASVDEVLEGEDADAVHAAILRYAREVAFATAEVYARAAEVRSAVLALRPGGARPDWCALETRDVVVFGWDYQIHASGTDGDPGDTGV